MREELLRIAKNLEAVEGREQEDERGLFACIDALRALADKAGAGPVAVVEFMGRRLTPENTAECWGLLLCEQKKDPPQGTKLYAAPPSQPVAHGPTAAEVMAAVDEQHEAERRATWTGGYVDRTEAGRERRRAAARRMQEIRERVAATISQPVALPDGWVAVPTRLTDEMRRAIIEEAARQENKWVYDADAFFRVLLAAAPEVPRG